MEIERTKEELIEVLGMLPINNQDLRYNLTEVFNRVKNVILETKIVEPKIDTELEEAKKRFPVGSWFTCLDHCTAYKVTEVERDPNFKRILVCSKGYKSNINICTPLAVYTRSINWRCMKTDAPDTARTVLINLDGKYYSAYHSKGSIWYVEGFSINMSNYTSALWCELPEIDGE